MRKTVLAALLALAIGGITAFPVQAASPQPLVQSHLSVRTTGGWVSCSIGAATPQSVGNGRYYSYGVQDCTSGAGAGISSQDATFYIEKCGITWWGGCLQWNSDFYLGGGVLAGPGTLWLPYYGSYQFALQPGMYRAHIFGVVYSTIGVLRDDNASSSVNVS